MDIAGRMCNTGWPPPVDSWTHMRPTRHAGRKVRGYLEPDPEGFPDKFARTDGVLKRDAGAFGILQLDDVSELAQTIDEYTAAKSSKVGDWSRAQGDNDEPLVIMKVDGFFPAALETFLLVLTAELDEVVLGWILPAKIMDDLIGRHFVLGGGDFLTVKGKVDGVRHGDIPISRQGRPPPGGRLDYRIARSYNLRLRP